jgi:hypothetical protein
MSVPRGRPTFVAFRGRIVLHVWFTMSAWERPSTRGPAGAWTGPLPQVGSAAMGVHRQDWMDPSAFVLQQQR